VRPDRRELAASLYEAGREHDAAFEDRLARWRNVEPETAELLSVLVRGSGARRVLEVGTSNGYSTLWLADAVEAAGGTLVSLEVLPERTALATGNLATAGLSEVADLLTADAGPALTSFEDAAFDFVFLDAERPAYVAYWPDLVRILAHPGLLVVDNAISHAEEMADFREVVSADERVESSLVPIGAGVLLIAPA
jgi:predicted O-methyltransferase YrrM